MKRQKKLIWIWNENVNNLHYLSRRFIGSVHLNHIQIEWHVDCGWNFGLFASVQPNCLTACGRAPNCKTVQRTGTDNLSTLLLSNACSGRPPLTAHTSVICKLMVSAIATFQCRFSALIISLLLDIGVQKATASYKLAVLTMLAAVNAQKIN